MTRQLIMSVMVLSGLLTSAVAADKLEKRKSPKGAKMYIISPKDGKTVGKKFTVRFGLKGMGVAPAAIDKENTGHHHHPGQDPLQVPYHLKGSSAASFLPVEESEELPHDKKGLLPASGGPDSRGLQDLQHHNQG